MKRSIKILLVILISLMTLCILPACQPTPDKQIIIQKDNFEDLVRETPASADSGETTADSAGHKNWQDSHTFEPRKGVFIETSITVDADVDEVPSSAPVLLVEPDAYDLSFVQKAVDYFVGSEYYRAGYTKDDWLIKIVPIRKAISAMNEDDRNIDFLKSLLDVFERRYENAPDKSKPGSLEFESTTFGDCVAIKGYPHDGVISELYIGNISTSELGFTGIYYIEEAGERTYWETPVIYSGTPAREMDTSFEKAKDMAKEAIYALYGEEMSLAQTCYANASLMDKNYTFIPKMQDTCPQCYVFYYTPMYNGVPQLYAPRATNYDEYYEEGEKESIPPWDREYSMKWPAEYLKVFVDDTGVFRFWASSPAKVTQTVNDGVALLPFDDIFEKFKRDIFYSSAWVMTWVKRLDITIDNINFGMIRVPKKDDPEQYYMVPAWQFIGSAKMESAVSGDQNYYESGRTFMVLNAIDGSIIDTSYFVDNELAYEKDVGVDKSDY